MKAFLLKYKWTILSWLIFLAILLFLAPKQKDYYLNNDIEDFKEHYLLPTLIWAGIAISMVFLVILIARDKPLKQSLLPFLYIIFTVAFLLFIFQDLFLAGALFINREFKTGSLQKVYVVKYTDVELTKNNFCLYDTLTKSISTDQKLIKLSFQPGLKPNDTVRLKFEEGLLGIKFHL